MKIWTVIFVNDFEPELFDSAEKAYDYIIDAIYETPYIETDACIAELKEEFKLDNTSFGVEDFVWAMACEVH